MLRYARRLVDTPFGLGDFEKPQRLDRKIVTPTAGVRQLDNLRDDQRGRLIGLRGKTKLCTNRFESALRRDRNSLNSRPARTGVG
jgi:hypothetical protein